MLRSGGLSWQRDPRHEQPPFEAESTFASDFRISETKYFSSLMKISNPPI